MEIDLTSLYPQGYRPEQTRQNLLNAFDKNPEQVAGDIRLAERWGTTPTEVAGRRDDFARQADADEIMRKTAQTPAVTAFINANPHNAALLRDDVDNAVELGRLWKAEGEARRPGGEMYWERSRPYFPGFFDRMGLAWSRGVEGVRQALDGSRALILENLFAYSEESQEEAAALLGKIKEQQQAWETMNIGESGNLAVRLLENSVIATPQLLSQVGSALLPGGGPLLSLASITSQVSGGQYADLRQQGVAAQRAMTASLLNAALQSPLEMFALDKMLNVFKAAGLGRVIQAGAVQGLSEASTEYLQEYVDSATGIWGTAELNKQDLGRQAAFFLDSLGQTHEQGLLSALAVLPFGLFGAGGKMAYEYGLARAAWHDARFFAALDASAQGSKLRQRLPQAYESLAAQLSKNGPVDTVYVKAEIFRQTIGDEARRQDLLAKVGLSLEDADRAEALGADLAIPLPKYQAHLAGTELSLQLRPHLKFSPEAMTLSEARAWEEKAQARYHELVREMEQDEAERQAFAAAVEPIRAELAALHGEEAAQADMELLRAGAIQAAARWSVITGEKISPTQWVQKIIKLQTQTADAPVRAGEEDLQAFVREAANEAAPPSETYFDFAQRAVGRGDGRFGGQGVWLASDRVRLIKENHPDFTAWEGIPEVIDNGEILPLGYSRATDGPAYAFTLEQGESTFVVIAAPVEGQSGQGLLVLTAFKDNPEAVRAWLAGEEQHADSAQSAGETADGAEAALTENVRRDNAAAEPERAGADPAESAADAAGQGGQPGGQPGGQGREPIFPTERITEAEESLRQDTAAWKEKIKAFFSRRLSKRRPVVLLSRTPLLLQALGLDNLPIAAAYNTLKEILLDKHNLPPETLQQIPAALADPIMVFDSGAPNGNLILLLALKDGQGNMVGVPVALSRAASGRYTLHPVKGVYGQEDAAAGKLDARRLAAQIAAGRLLYQNQPKSRAWAAGLGLQLPLLSGPDPVAPGLYTEADLGPAPGQSAAPAAAGQPEYGYAGDAARAGNQAGVIYFQPLNAGVDPEQQVAVVDLSGASPVNVTAAEAKKFVAKWQGAPLEISNEPNGAISVRLSRKDPDHPFWSSEKGSRHDPARRAALAELDKVLAGAVRIEDLPPKHSGVRRTIRFYVPVTREDGAPATMRIVAHELVGQQAEIDGVELYDIIRERPYPPSDQSVTVGGATGRSLTVTIKQMLSGVKDGGGKVYFQAARTEGTTGLLPGGAGNTSQAQPGRPSPETLFQPANVQAAEESLRRDVAAWGQAIDSFVAGGLNKRRPVVMFTQTPLVLQLLGAENLPIVTNHGILHKVIYGKHMLPPDLLKQIPAALADPIMVLRTESESATSDFTVMLDLKDEAGSTVVVPVSLRKSSGRRKGYAVNFLPSIYVKNDVITKKPRNDWFIKQLNRGNALYLNRPKIKDWIDASRRYLPGGGPSLDRFWADSRTISAVENILNTEADLVKLKSRNPTLYQSARPEGTAEAGLAPDLPGEESSLDRNGADSRSIPVDEHYIYTEADLVNLKTRQPDLSQPAAGSAAQATGPGAGGPGYTLRGLLQGDGRPVGKIYSQPAYHASPTRFERFNLDYIGRGMGAQEYGWGLYFTDNKEMAEKYRQHLAGSVITVKGQPVFAHLHFQANDFLVQALRKAAESDPKATRAQRLHTAWGILRRQYLETEEPFMRKFLMEAVQALDSLKGKAFEFETGQLYQVDIPEVREMLDWNLPFAEQPADVRAALQQAAAEGLLPQEFLNAGSRATGKEIYRALAQALHSGEAASKRLNALGVKGIRYQNDLGRREGSYNFVVFDDAAITILKTYYQSSGGKIGPNVVGGIRPETAARLSLPGGGAIVLMPEDLWAIEEAQGASIRDLGFADAREFAEHVLAHVDAVYQKQPENAAPVYGLAARLARPEGQAIATLEFVAAGDHFLVRAAAPLREEYLHGATPLWARAGSELFPPGTSGAAEQALQKAGRGKVYFQGLNADVDPDKVVPVVKAEKEKLTVWECIKGPERKAIIESIFGTVFNEPSGLSFGFSKTNADHLLSSATNRGMGGPEHIAAVRKVRELMRIAELIESHDDGKNQPGVTKVHRFFAPMEYDGAIYTVKMTVKEYGQKDSRVEITGVLKLYDLKLEKKTPIRLADAGGSKAPGIRQTGVFGITIRQMMEGVKDSEDKLFFQSAAPNDSGHPAAGLDAAAQRLENEIAAFSRRVDAALADQDTAANRQTSESEKKTPLVDDPSENGREIYQLGVFEITIKQMLESVKESEDKLFFLSVDSPGVAGSGHPAAGLAAEAQRLKSEIAAFSRQAAEAGRAELPAEGHGNDSARARLADNGGDAAAQSDPAARVRAIQARPAKKIQPGRPLGQKEAESLSRTFGKMENQRDHRVAELPVGTLGKILRHRGFDVSTILEDLPDLYNTALHGWSEQETTAKGHRPHENIKAYHQYINKFADKNGTEYYIRFTVTERKAKPGRTGDCYIHSTAISPVAVYENGAVQQSVRGIDPVLSEQTPFLDKKIQDFFNKVNTARTFYQSAPKGETQAQEGESRRAEAPGDHSARARLADNGGDAAAQSDLAARAAFASEAQAQERESAATSGETAPQSSPEQLRARYAGTALWMKAPDGSPSGLTEQQWLEVRTPEFKAWFGDWEGAARLAALPALDLGGVEPLADKKGVKQAFRSFGIVINKADGRQVLFPMSIAGKIYRHQGFDTERIAAALDRLFSEAIPMFSELEGLREGHKEHKNIREYHQYLAKFTLPESGRTQEYYIRFTVQEMTAKPGPAAANNVHSSFVSEVAIYDESASSEWVRDNPAILPEQRAYRDKKLAHWLDSVKAASQIVAENGEPLLVRRRAAEDSPSAAKGFFFTRDQKATAQDATGAPVEPGSAGAEPDQALAYLRLRNPLLVDLEGKAYPGDAEIIRQAVAQGRDGAIIRNSPDPSLAGRETSEAGVAEPEVYLVLQPEQIRPANRPEAAAPADPRSSDRPESPRQQQGEKFYQPMGGQPGATGADAAAGADRDQLDFSLAAGDAAPRVRGQVEFGRETVITLFKGAADLSTFLHEIGHVFIHDLEQAVATGRAPAQVERDLEALRAFAGDLDDTNAQEKLARAFEAYLREGKAPSPQLRSAFRRFAAWLTAIYATIAGLRVNITPEIRGVFNRMLAADMEIKAVETYRGDEAAGRDASKALLSEDEIRRCHAAAQRAHARSVEARQQRYLRAYWRSQGGKKAARAKAAAQVNAKPEYLAQEQALARGGLNRDGVLRDFGAAGLAALLKKRPGLVRVSGPVDMEQVAVANGFADAADLYNHILRSPGKIKEIADLTQEIIAEAEQALLAQTAEDGVLPGDEDYYTQERLWATLQAERVLAGKITAPDLGPGLGNAQRLRGQARQVLNGQTPRTAFNLALPSSAEVRAAQEAAKALAEGRWADALQAKRRQVLNQALSLEVLAAGQERREFAAFFRRAVNSAETPPGHKEQIKALAQKYGLAKVRPAHPDQLPSLAQFIAATAADDLFGPPPLEPWLLNGQKPQSLTLGHLREIWRTLRWLGEHGNPHLERLLSVDGHPSVRQAAEHGAAIIRRAGPTAAEAVTGPEAPAGPGRELLDGLAHFQRRLLLADGAAQAGRKPSKPGWHAHWWQRLLEARRSQAQLYRAEILPRLEQLEAARRAFVRRFAQTFGPQIEVLNGVAVPESLRETGRNAWTAEQVWCLARNMGNAADLQALQEGYGLSAADLLRLTAVLAESDWRAVQAEGRLLGARRRELERVFRQIYTKPMPEGGLPEPLVVRTAEGGTLTLQGWLFSTGTDPRRAAEFAQSGRPDLAGAAPQGAALGPAGSPGLPRLGAGRPARRVPLNFAVLEQTLWNQLHFITQAPLLKDFARISANPEWRAAYTAAFGQRAYRQLRLALRYYARPAPAQPVARAGLVDQQRRLGALSVLGENLSALCACCASLTQAAPALGLPWLIRGFGRCALSPQDAFASVKRLSAYMAGRDRDYERELRATLQTPEAEPAAREFALGLIGLGDRLCTFSLWQGACLKAAESLGLSPEAAVQYADDLLRRVRAPAAPPDLARWGRAGGPTRLYNLFRSEALRPAPGTRPSPAAAPGEESAPAGAAPGSAKEIMVPALLLTALGRLLAEGKPPDETEVKLALVELSVGPYPLLGQSLPAAGPNLGRDTALAGPGHAGKTPQKPARLLADPDAPETWADVYKAAVDCLAATAPRGYLRRLYQAAAGGWKRLGLGETHNPFSLFSEPSGRAGSGPGSRPD